MLYLSYASNKQRNKLQHSLNGNGFFDDLWSGIKNVGSSIYNGVKSVIGFVGDKIQPIVRTVGDIASYIPVIGAPISGIANQISRGIDVAKGFVNKVGDVGRGIGILKQPQNAQQFSRQMM